jgi:YgiT-type zinc finger domain-containing protein
MEEQTYNETVSQGGESIELTDMRGEVCPKCGEIVWDDRSYDRLFRAQDALVIKARNKMKKGKSRFHADTGKERPQTTS